MSETLQALLTQLSGQDRVQIRPVAGTGSSWFDTSYIGYIRESGLLLTTPPSPSHPLFLRKGDWLDVRLLLQGGFFSFQTTVLHVHQVPLTFFHLDFPARIENRDIREWPRVTLLQRLQVQGERAFSNGENTSPAKMVNISIGGALIEAPVQLGLLGSRIRLLCSLTMGEFTRDLEIPCVIRQVRVQEDRETGQAWSLHGVEFCLENVEDRVFISGYVFEQLFYAKTRRIV